MKTLLEQLIDCAHLENLDAAMMLKPIPEPPGWPFIGNLLELRDADYSLVALDRLAATYGPIYTFSNGRRKRVVVSSVEMMDDVCDEKRFMKQTAATSTLPQRDRDGLFTAHSKSQDWAVAHRVLMPAFGPLSIEGLFDGMHDIARQLCLFWARQGPDHLIHASDDFTRLTLDTIALTGMGYRFNSFYRQEQHPFVRAMVENLSEASRRQFRPAIATKLMTGTAAQVEANMDLQRNVSLEIINKRRNQTSPVQKDLLDTMLNGRDPKTGQIMDDKLIASNMQTFLVAGHETTSSLLTFVMYNLLKNPAAYLKAQREVDEVLGKGTMIPRHMKDLKYLNAVLRETLRLYPTAPAFSRVARPGAGEVVSVGGHALERNIPITVLLGRIHRDPTVYGEDADCFRPERMLDENFERLPQNAWKPFGTGVRGCIGRAFAWQESLLVTALLLQRFDFRLDNPAYDLKMQFNLTIKPKDMFIHATLRHGIDATDLEIAMTSGCQNPKPKLDTIGVSAPRAGPRINILFGSNTGTCEALAQRLAVDATSHGCRVSVQPLDAAAQIIPKDHLLLVISSSYDGQPPDNACRFIESLSRLGSDEAKNRNFAVFGCGHHDWVETFQRIPKLVSETLRGAGANELVERGVCDVANGHIFDDFDDWKDNKLWPAIFKSNGAEGTPESIPKPSKGLDMEMTTSNRTSNLRQDVVEVEVIANEVLTVPAQPEKRHCSFRMPDRLSYQCGDYLGVLPLNTPQLVDRIMKRFDVPWDASLKVQRGSSTTLPIDRWLSARDVLTGHVELKGPITLKDLRLFHDLARNATEKGDISQILKARDEAPATWHPPSALAILEKYPSIDLAFKDFLALLPPLRLRLYSISSSPSQDPSLCTITYSVHQQVHTDLEIDDRPEGKLGGVASTYLANLKPGSKASVSLRPGKDSFRPPQTIEAASSTPIIMICAGTGLAPFRGFVEERFAQLTAQKDLALAPAVLYIGNRFEDKDRLYQAELDKWESEGAVKLRYAFSQERAKAKGCAYVQERVATEAEEIKELWKQGAKVFVCGSNTLVVEVRKTLWKVLENTMKQASMGDERMEKEIKKIKETERFVADNFG